MEQTGGSNQNDAIKKMGLIFYCPDKLYRYLFLELGAFIFIRFWYLGYYAIPPFVIAGTALGMLAIIRFLRPQLFPRLTLLSDGEQSEKFNQWYQRIIALILFGVSIDMVTLYRLQEMTEPLFFRFLPCAALQFLCIVWIVRFSKEQTRTARVFVWMCSIIILVWLAYFGMEAWRIKMYMYHHLYYRNSWRDLAIFRFVIPFILFLIVTALFTRVHQIEKQRKKIGRYVLSHIIFPFAVLIVAWIILGNYLALKKEKAVQKAWEENVYPLVKAKNYFPQTKKNKSAEKLEELTLKLGLDFKYLDVWPRRFTIQDEIWRDVHSDLREYLYKQLEKPEMIIDAPPEKVMNFLTFNSATLEAIKKNILAHGKPQWDINPNDYLHSSFDHLELLSLQQILFAKILADLSQGQQQNMLDFMETSWKINEAIDKFPSYFFNISNYAMKWQAGALRKIDTISDRWNKRMNTETGKMILIMDFENYFAKFIDFEHAMTDQINDSSFIDDIEFDKKRPIVFMLYYDIVYDRLPKFFWKILNPVMNPYYRLCYADYSYKTLQALLLFQKEGLCNYDQEEFKERYIFSLTSWNRIDEILQSQSDILPQKLLRLNLRELDLGLTAEIIKIRNNINEAKKGSLISLESSVCKNAHWNYYQNKDTTWCISYSKVPASYKNKEEHWLYLPLRFCSTRNVTDYFAFDFIQ